MTIKTKYTLTFTHSAGHGTVMDTEGVFLVTDQGPQHFSLITTEQDAETGAQRLKDLFGQFVAGGSILVKNAAGKFEALTPQEI